MAIDDPLGHIDSGATDSDANMLAKILNVLGPLLALLNPSAGAAVSVAGYFRQLLDDRRADMRIESWRQGLLDGVRSLGASLDRLEDRVSGIDAEEAVVAAARGAILTARVDRAYRMGRVLGSTIAAEQPRWREAAEFIRDLEEFNEDDLATMRLLWREQKQEFRDKSSGEMQMSTDNPAYMSKWTAMLAHVSKAGVTKDDWLSRCARLSGFGLTVPVDSPNRAEANHLPCYRLTSRAVRLLQALGLFLPPNAYPVVRYHPTLGSRTFQNEDEDADRGEGWFDDPTFRQPSVGAFGA